LNWPCAQFRLSVTCGSRPAKKISPGSRPFEVNLTEYPISENANSVYSCVTSLKQIAIPANSSEESREPREDEAPLRFGGMTAVIVHGRSNLSIGIRLPKCPVPICCDDDSLINSSSWLKPSFGRRRQAASVNSLRLCANAGRKGYPRCQSLDPHRAAFTAAIPVK
jgi:hypothetical protein